MRLVDTLPTLVTQLLCLAWDQMAMCKLSQDIVIINSRADFDYISGN